MTPRTYGIALAFLQTDGDAVGIPVVRRWATEMLGIPVVRRRTIEIFTGTPVVRRWTTVMQ